MLLVLTLLVAMAAFNLIAMVPAAIRQQTALAMLSSLGPGGAQLRGSPLARRLCAGGGILAGVLGGAALCAVALALVVWISSFGGRRSWGPTSFTTCPWPRPWGLPRRDHCRRRPGGPGDYAGGSSR